MSSSNWSQKLFGCTNDIETCKNRLLLQFTIVYATLVLGCCGAFCGPCLMCRNAGYLDKSGFLCCFLGVLLPCIPFFLLRGATREKYNIEVHTSPRFQRILLKYFGSFREVFAKMQLQQCSVVLASIVKLMQKSKQEEITSNFYLICTKSFFLKWMHAINLRLSTSKIALKDRNYEY